MQETVDVYNPVCPSRQLLALVAQRWSVLVIHALAEGIARPADLKRKIGGISHKMLTQTLRDLQQGGLVQRTAYAEVPPRVEYTLTEAGVDIAPLLEAICQWAEKHVTVSGGLTGDEPAQ